MRTASWLILSQATIAVCLPWKRVVTKSHEEIFNQHPGCIPNAKLIFVTTRVSKRSPNRRALGVWRNLGARIQCGQSRGVCVCQSPTSLLLADWFVSPGSGIPLKPSAVVAFDLEPAKQKEKFSQQRTSAKINAAKTRSSRLGRGASRGRALDEPRYPRLAMRERQLFRIALVSILQRLPTGVDCPQRPLSS